MMAHGGQDRSAATGVLALVGAVLVLPVCVAALVGGIAGPENWELAFEAFFYTIIFLLISALATPVFLLFRRVLRWQRSTALLAMLLASWAIHALLLFTRGPETPDWEDGKVLVIELSPVIELLLHLPMILLLRWLDTTVASAPDR
ncbi:hypothetical protein ACVFYP_07965 [Roseomonas sp. F4]